MNKYRITVEKSFQPIPEAYVNGNQIQQVLLNLLINARQAMPGGGRVMLKLAYDAQSDMVDLVVRDNGCGIPADKLPRIFEPFYTTKSRPGRQRQGRHGPGAFHVPRDHRGASRPDPRRQHGRQGDGLYAEAAHGGQGRPKTAARGGPHQPAPAHPLPTTTRLRAGIRDLGIWGFGWGRPRLSGHHVHRDDLNP